MVKDLTIALFAVAAGFTLSGIVTNFYRVAVGNRQSGGMAQSAHLAVMVLAGPNLLVENAASSFRAKKCSGWVLWFAAAVAGYWSFVLGLFLLNLAIVL